MPQDARGKPYPKSVAASTSAAHQLDPAAPWPEGTLISVRNPAYATWFYVVYIRDRVPLQSQPVTSLTDLPTGVSSSEVLDDILTNECTPCKYIQTHPFRAISIEQFFSS
jgi:hypothetical protein